MGEIGYCGVVRRPCSTSGSCHAIIVYMSLRYERNNDWVVTTINGTYP